MNADGGVGVVVTDEFWAGGFEEVMGKGNGGGRFVNLRGLSEWWRGRRSDGLKGMGSQCMDRYGRVVVLGVLCWLTESHIGCSYSGEIG